MTPLPEQRMPQPELAAMEPVQIGRDDGAAGLAVDEVDAAAMEPVQIGRDDLA